MHLKRPDIHKFEERGHKLLFDVGTLTFMKVDDLTYQVLDYYGHRTNKEIIDALRFSYPVEQILEVLEELTYLEEQGLLRCRQNFEISLPDVSTIKLNNIVLHVANKCNLRCVYCYAGDGNYGYYDGPFMSEEVATRAIRFLIENAGENKDLAITFFGGEPLLNIGLIKFVVNLCKKYERSENKKFSFSITTNGTLLSDEIIQFLNEHKFAVLVSMDGSKQYQDVLRPFANGKGSWDVVAPRVEKFLRTRQGDAMVRITVTRENVHISTQIRELTKLGFSRVLFAPVKSDKDWLNLCSEDYKTLASEFQNIANEYLKNLEKKETSIKSRNLQMLLLDLHKGKKKIQHCGAAFHMVAVDPFGDIYPCQRFVGTEAYKLGNVNIGLDQQARRDFFSLCTQIYKKCKTCWVRHYCLGGCYHDLLKVEGSVPAIRSREECNFIRRQYEIAMGVYTELAEKHPQALKHFDRLIDHADNNS